jgi:hypothetical protein
MAGVFLLLQSPRHLSEAQGEGGLPIRASRGARQLSALGAVER